MPGIFLRASNLRPDTKRWLSCGANALGLKRGHFPGTIATDAGNGGALKLDRPIYDEGGKFAGVAYRQSDGCEVLVLLD